MIQAALLTMLLATGEVHHAEAAPRASEAIAWAYGPYGRAHTHAHRPYAPRKIWPHSASPNRWLWRYTIVDGTHYVVPRDYRTELDLPWHHRGPQSAPQALMIAPEMRLESLPEGIVPPPPPELEETIYPDVQLGPQARRPR